MALFAAVNEIYYQTIYCEGPPARMWQREITMSRGAAMIGKAHMLLPEEVAALEHQAKADKVVLHRGPVVVRAAVNTCMFCNETAVFVCVMCGRMSCVRVTWPILRCKVCKGSVRERHWLTEGFMPMSRTGFIHAWEWFRRPSSLDFTATVQREIVLETVIERPSLPEPAKHIEPPRPLELPAPEKEDARARLRKYLKEKRGE